MLRNAIKELGIKSNMLVFINDKIKSLEHLLDGGPPSEEPAGTLMLDGEETTIVEVLDKPTQNNGVVRSSQNTFKQHIEKYKQLRQKINKALSNEPVSGKTKTLVTSTLDSMLAQMIEHECKWNNGPQANRPDPGRVMESWTRMWDTIKGQYNKMLTEEQQYDEKQQFLKNLHEFFTNLYGDIQYLSQNYKVVCQFVKPNQNGRIPFIGFGTNDENSGAWPRAIAQTPVQKQFQSNKVDDPATCQNFRVCYIEIKDFMVDLYKNLNETGVSSVSNYAAMYQRDVNEDSRHEKEKVIASLNKASKKYEYKIDKLFRKQLTKFNLDPKRNRYANIKLINEFISNSIENTKIRGNKMLKKHLKFLSPKLVMNILQDIAVNMDMDFGNLERDFSEKICAMFETCNGKYVMSRKAGKSFVSDNGVYVKVQLTLNDDEKDQIARKIMAVNTIKTTTSLPYGDVTRTIPQIQRLIAKEPKKGNKIESFSSIKKLKQHTISPTTFLVIYKK